MIYTHFGIIRGYNYTQDDNELIFFNIFQDVFKKKAKMKAIKASIIRRDLKEICIPNMMTVSLLDPEIFDNFNFDEEYKILRLLNSIKILHLIKK